MIFLNNYNVYKHTFPDGKIYIGVSINPLKRWSNGHGYYFNVELDKAIQEVGWENIKCYLGLIVFYGIVILELVTIAIVNGGK